MNLRPSSAASRSLILSKRASQISGMIPLSDPYPIIEYDLPGCLSTFRDQLGSVNDSGESFTKSEKEGANLNQFDRLNTTRGGACVSPTNASPSRAHAKVVHGKGTLTGKDARVEPLERVIQQVFAEVVVQRLLRRVPRFILASRRPAREGSEWSEPTVREKVARETCAPVRLVERERLRFLLE